MSDFDEAQPFRGVSPSPACSRKLLVTWATVGIVCLAVLAVVLVVVFTAGPTRGGPVVVLMLGDGFGPASVSLLRAYLNHTGVRNRLHLDDFLVGSVQTASLDSRITDSAAGATSYACGKRVLNDWVGTTSDGRACGTLAEAAKRRGMRVGLVSKTTVSNASPAAFSSHAQSRYDEQFIAGQQIRQGFDVLLGGGMSAYSFRFGGRASALDEAVARGYRIVQTAQQLAAAAAAPVLGLFAADRMEFVIDAAANSTQPSLAAMALGALRLLRAADKDGKGVFLFVEGSFIDLAGHDNDAATQVRESHEYDDTFRVLADAVGAAGTVVSLADHATGGLALGRNYPGPTYPDPYAFFVRRLATAKMSVHRLALSIVGKGVFPFAALVNETLGLALTAAQEAQLNTWAQQGDVQRFTRELSEMLSTTDLISWSSWGHDAVDVGLYCAGNCPAQLLRGSLRNDVVGQQLAQLLGVGREQQDITAQLAQFNTTGHPDGWQGDEREEL